MVVASSSFFLLYSRVVSVCNVKIVVWTKQLYISLKSVFPPGFVSSHCFDDIQYASQQILDLDGKLGFKQNI